MPLRIKCPSGHSLIVSESRAGQAFRCPKCQGEVRMPGEAVKPPPSITARPPEEKLAAAKPPVLEKKPIVKPPAAKQPPVPLPPLPSIPVTLVSEGIEFKEIEPPPVVLRVPQVADDEPKNPLPAARQVPPPAKIANPAADPALPPIVFMEAETTRPAPPPPVAPQPPLEPVSPPSPRAAAPAPRLPTPVPAIELPLLVVHSPQQVAIVFQLAAAMIVAAVFSISPSAWDLFDYASGTSASPLGRWAIVLGMLGAVQVAYAIYLIQLPDWTTVWMVTLFALASAALYAMALGLTIISGEDGWVVGLLQLSDKVAGGTAWKWCLCMMSVMTLLAFFAGRISVRWRQAEAILREAA